MSIADDLRRRRETWVTAGGWRFLLRRPRELDMVLWAQAGGNTEIVLQSVAGWEGPTHDDVLGNGEKAPAPWSAELAREWLPDRVDLMVELWEQLQTLIKQHADARASAEKN